MITDRIEIRRKVTKLCPFVDEADTGRLVLVIAGDAPELHDLGARIDAIGTGKRISHEDWTSAVAALVPGCGAVSFWHTGGWSVRVERGDPALCAAVADDDPALAALFAWGHDGCPGRFAFAERLPAATVYACLLCGQHRVAQDDPAAHTAALAGLASALTDAADQRG